MVEKSRDFCFVLNYKLPSTFTPFTRPRGQLSPPLDCPQANALPARCTRGTCHPPSLNKAAFILHVLTAKGCRKVLCGSGSALGHALVALHIYISLPRGGTARTKSPKPRYKGGATWDVGCKSRPHQSRTKTHVKTPVGSQQVKVPILGGKALRRVPPRGGPKARQPSTCRLPRRFYKQATNRGRLLEPHLHARARAVSRGG